MTMAEMIPTAPQLEAPNDLGDMLDSSESVEEDDADGDWDPVTHLPPPSEGQRIEMRFSDSLWYRGTVTLFEGYTNLGGDFDDGQIVKEIKWDEESWRYAIVKSQRKSGMKE